MNADLQDFKKKKNYVVKKNRKKGVGMGGNLRVSESICEPLKCRSGFPAAIIGIGESGLAQWNNNLYAMRGVFAVNISGFSALCPLWLIVFKQFPEFPAEFFPFFELFSCGTAFKFKGIDKLPV